MITRRTKLRTWGAWGGAFVVLVGLWRALGIEPATGDGHASARTKRISPETIRLKKLVKHHVPLLGLDEEQLEALAELGYVDWVTTDTPDVSGVTIHDRERAWAGLTLYKSFAATEAHLIDMDGQVVHTWQGPDPADGKWQHVELLPGGQLLGLARNGKYLEKLDWDSTLLWRVELSAHHDLDVAQDGRVFVLIEKFREVSIRGLVLPIIDNGIAILSPDGELLEEVWLAPLFADLIPDERVDRIQRHIDGEPGDWQVTGGGLQALHTNTVEVLRRDVPGLGRVGQVLISLRSLNLIAVVDLAGPRLVWSWGPGEIDAQHQPTLLPNDHLLVFDNGTKREWSRVIEFDPHAEQIVWEYRSDPPVDFYTSSRGGSEMLPNGNVLVAEANRGRLFEVTREGDIVWEFLNPDVQGNKRGTIYRAHRLTSEELGSLPLETGDR